MIVGIRDRVFSGRIDVFSPLSSSVPVMASIAAHASIGAVLALSGAFHTVDTGQRTATEPISVSLVVLPQKSPPVQTAVAPSPPAPPRPSPTESVAPAPRPQPQPVMTAAAQAASRPPQPQPVMTPAAAPARSAPAPREPVRQNDFADTAAAPTGARPGPDNPHPLYPGVSRRRGEEGRVVLRVVVEHDGRIAALSVDHSSGFRRLDQAALNAVEKWRFEPAQRGGAAIKGVAHVPIRFVLQ